jgi:histidine triad (HIT) family protein
MTTDCIFCRIAAGTLAAEIVHETPHALAFLDRHPVARGHVLVVPRAHAATLLELEDAAVGELFGEVKTVMRKVTAALAPVAMNVGWNHGQGAGQHVLHLHVHVLPRYSAGGRGVQVLGERPGSPDLPALARALREA